MTTCHTSVSHGCLESRIQKSCHQKRNPLVDLPSPLQRNHCPFDLFLGGGSACFVRPKTNFEKRKGKKHHGRRIPCIHPDTRDPTPRRHGTHILGPSIHATFNPSPSPSLHNKHIRLLPMHPSESAPPRHVDRSLLTSPPSSRTSLTANASISFDGTACSSTSFCAVSTPATGTRYSHRLCRPDPSTSSSPGTGYGNGRYSGISPSCLSTVPWSHEMCS